MPISTINTQIVFETFALRHAKEVCFESEKVKSCKKISAAPNEFYLFSFSTQISLNLHLSPLARALKQTKMSLKFISLKITIILIKGNYGSLESCRILFSSRKFNDVFIQWLHRSWKWWCNLKFSCKKISKQSLLQSSSFPLEKRLLFIYILVWYGAVSDDCLSLIDLTSCQLILISSRLAMNKIIKFIFNKCMKRFLHDSVWQKYMKNLLILPHWAQSRKVKLSTWEKKKIGIFFNKNEWTKWEFLLSDEKTS